MKIKNKLEEEKVINRKLVSKIDECGVNERSLNKEISSLQTELVQRVSTIEIIKADKTTVSKEAKELKDELTKLKHEKVASTREIAKLTTQIEEMKTETDVLKSEIELLNQPKP